MCVSVCVRACVRGSVHVFVCVCLCVCLVVCVYLMCCMCAHSKHVGNSTMQLVRFGRGSGTSILSQTVCHGNETSLLNCTHAQVGSRECTYQQDASATCIGEYHSSHPPFLPSGSHTHTHTHTHTPYACKWHVMALML